MFVERLSVAQVKDFLNEIYPEEQCFSYSISMSKCTPYIRVCICNYKTMFNLDIQLKDYDAITIYKATISWPHKWLKYLYKVFGEEYKQAYIQECLSVFDED